MKPAVPNESIVPWASEHIIPWIFSMIAISASKRSSAAEVYSFTTDLIVGNGAGQEIIRRILKMP
jgi:hypothetical protein